MTVLCHVDEIADQSCKGFEIGERSLFAVKKGGQIYLYDNQCPHLGVELNWQEDQFLDMDGALIQCTTHGALFVIEDGKCVAGPCIGKKLRSVPFTLENNQITLTPV